MKGGVAVLLLAFALSGCGEGGALSVRIFGEDYIEESIPAEAFSDGWAVTFDTFLISVRSISAARREEAPALAAEVNWVVDLAKGSGGEGVLLLERSVPAADYDDVSYRIAPAVSGASNVNASAEEVTGLISEGASLRMVGRALKGALEKRFDWSFDTDTTYVRCASTAQVSSGGAATVQLTIHGDHLFYDDLFDAEPNVAFQLIADADRDVDHVVTLEELAATELRTQTRYATGSTGITNLADFIRHQTTTLGHIDGEGHCDATQRQ